MDDEEGAFADGDFGVASGECGVVLKLDHDFPREHAARPARGSFQQAKSVATHRSGDGSPH